MNLTDETNDNNVPNKNVNNYKSFKCKTKTDDDGNLADNPNYDQNKRGTKDVKTDVPIKHLGNFCSSLNIPLINCEGSLILSWSANCVIAGVEKRLVRTAQGTNPEVLW